MSEQLRVCFPNNPFVPPSGDICFITNLPPELLSPIFELCFLDKVDDEADDYWNSIHCELRVDDEGETDEENAGLSGSPYRSLPFSVVISHVCRYWRDVAVSTPSLWTKIIVTTASRPPYEFESTLLKRSHNLPVDIYIDYDPLRHGRYAWYHGEPPDDVVISLFSILAPHIHRWRTIKLSAWHYDHMYFLLNTVSDPSVSAAPQLKTLDLRYDCEFDRHGDLSMSKDITTLFGGSAPLLTRLVIWRVPVDWEQPWITSASNLTDLEVCFHREQGRPTWEEFATILRGAPALKKLTIRWSGPSMDPTEWLLEQSPDASEALNALIHLPQVTDLHFAFLSQVYATGLLRHFYLPALKKLVLEFYSTSNTQFVHALAGPATSLYPGQTLPYNLLNRLEHLAIYGLPCHIECIKILYSELHSLRSLYISLQGLPPLFLDVLCAPCLLIHIGDVWLPGLEMLHVVGASGDVLRKVVQKRINMGAPIGSLYVQKSRELKKEDIAWLKKNVKKFTLLKATGRRSRRIS